MCYEHRSCHFQQTLLCCLYVPHPQKVEYVVVEVVRSSSSVRCIRPKRTIKAYIKLTFILCYGDVAQRVCIYGSVQGHTLQAKCCCRCLTIELHVSKLPRRAQITAEHHIV